MKATEILMSEHRVIEQLLQLIAALLGSLVPRLLPFRST